MFVVKQQAFTFICELTLLGVESETLESWKSFVQYQNLGLLGEEPQSLMLVFSCLKVRNCFSYSLRFPILYILPIVTPPVIIIHRKFPIT